MNNKPPLSLAAKIQMLTELIKRKEIHTCDKCDHTHEVELGLLEPEEVKKLFYTDEEE